MKALNRTLIEAEFLSSEGDVSGSRIYLPAGWAVRNLIFRKASLLLDAAGFQEFHMPSILRKSHIERLDNLTPISSKYFPLTEDLRLAATHEAVFFPFALEQIAKRGRRLPLNLYHLGPAYRSPRTAPVPFNLGERFSYLEVFSVCRPNEYERWSGVLFSWATQMTISLMNLPSVRVRRPRYGNLGFSDQTLTVETMLPLGRTFCTAMVYRQGSMFTRLFSMGDEPFSGLKSVHAGITDNLFFAYLANCMDADGFTLHSEFAVTQVLISCPENDERSRALAHSLKIRLEAIGARALISFRASRNASRDLGLFRKQGIPVFISIEPVLARDGCGRAYSRSSPSKGTVIDLSNAPEINALIVAHDIWMARRLEAFSEASIGHARNLDECKELIRAGKIARFYLQDDGAAVAELDAMLPGAEVLGYDTEPLNYGGSILNGSQAGKICYAAKRL